MGKIVVLSTDVHIVDHIHILCTTVKRKREIVEAKDTKEATDTIDMTNMKIATENEAKTINHIATVTHETTTKRLKLFCAENSFATL